jgi:hypothetical protein
VPFLARALADRGRVSLGHDERREQLMRSHGGERSDVCLLALELRDASLEAADLSLEHGHRERPIPRGAAGSRGREAALLGLGGDRLEVCE